MLGELRADDARFFTNEGRLQAEAALSRRRSSGILYREWKPRLLAGDRFQDVRDDGHSGRERVRPIAVLTPRQENGVGVENDAYTVVGDRIFLLGADYFTAVDVRIEQDSLEAFTQTQQNTSWMVADWCWRVMPASAANTIWLGANYVEPTRRPKRTSSIRDETPDWRDELLLTSAQILLFLEDDQLERLVATPIVDPGSLPRTWRTESVRGRRGGFCPYG